MAKLIPSLNNCLSRMQAGEKRFARRLESHLEDDYLCWYELPVGFRHRYSDFIVLHPQRGLLLLEVKDWKLETIRCIDRTSATLLTPQGLKTVANPLEQVRQCAYQLVRQLEKDPQLIHHGGRYQGKLMTMHSSKGLEFPVVAIPGLGYLPAEGADPVTEAKLLYVAMTRSTDKLLLTGHRENEFLHRLQETGEQLVTIP